jgi:manganese transport protein
MEIGLDEINGWLEASENPMFMAYRCSIGIYLILLLYIVFKPFVTKSKIAIQNHSPHNLKLFSKSKATLKKDIAVSVFICR